MSQYNMCGIELFPEIPAFGDDLMRAIADGNRAQEWLPEIKPFIEFASIPEPRFSFETIGGISLNADKSEAAPQVATFIANRKTLVKRLTAVAKFSPRKTAKAILQTVRVSVNGTVEFAATDRESSIVTDDDFDREGEVSGLVYPARLLSVLKGLKCDIVECQLTGEALTVIGPSASLSVPVQQFMERDRIVKPDGTVEMGKERPMELPLPKLPTADIVFVANASDLAHAISQTIYCTDPESHRFALGGILFEIARFGDGPAVLNLAATDTRRLAVSAVGSIDLLTGEPDGEKDTFVVPAGFLNSLRPFIDAAETVQIGFCRAASGEWGSVIISGTDQLSCGQTKWQASSILIAGRFPRYRDVIPCSPARELAFEKAQLIDALTIAAQATNEESPGIDFEIPDASGNCVVTIRGKSADAGESFARVSAGQVITGPAVSVITFDPRYLLEYLGNLPKGCKYVQLALVDSNSAAILTASEQSGKHIAMPLSRDR